MLKIAEESVVINWEIMALAKVQLSHYYDYFSHLLNLY